MICCGQTFESQKSFSNHKRWCSGKIAYKKDTGYFGIHAWVRKRKAKPNLCEQCNNKGSMDLANKSGNYLRNINDYIYLCRSCHKIMDYTKETKVKLSIAVQNRLRNEGGLFI